MKTMYTVEEHLVKRPLFQLGNRYVVQKLKAPYLSCFPIPKSVEYQVYYFYTSKSRADLKIYDVFH